MRNTIRAGAWGWMRGTFPGNRRHPRLYPRAMLGARIMLALLIAAGAVIVLAWLLLMPPQA